MEMDWKGFCKLLDACEEKALEEVPRSHRRILAETKHELAKEYILSAVGEEEAEINAGDWILFTSQRNIGTMKYPYMIKIVEFEEVVKPCSKICITCYGTRPNAERILAVCKAKE